MMAAAGWEPARLRLTIIDSVHRGLWRETLELWNGPQHRPGRSPLESWLASTHIGLLLALLDRKGYNSLPAAS